MPSKPIHPPKPILPPGYVYDGYIAKGGQASIFKALTPAGATASEGGFFSLKDKKAELPEAVAIRQILDIVPEPMPNETDREKEDRLKELCALAREVNASLHFAAGHPFVDVIGIYRGIRGNGSTELYFVMPFYDVSLWHYVETIEKYEEVNGRGVRGFLNEDVLRFVMVQILAALRRMHSKGYAHRDATAANILLRDTPAGPLVHLADFGYAQLSGVVKKNTLINDCDSNNVVVAHEEVPNDDDADGGFRLDGESDTTEAVPAPLSVYSQLTNSKKGPYTGAGTTPFRAPESLFHCTNIDSTKLDIWAAGIDFIFCILRRLDQIPLTHNRLFSYSSEITQLKQIFSLIAPYDALVWERIANNRDHGLHDEIMRMPKNYLYDSHDYFLPTEISAEGLAVLKAMLQPVPDLRPSATEILAMPWFVNSPAAMMILHDIDAIKPPASAEPKIDFTDKNEDFVRSYLFSKSPVIDTR